MTDTPEAPPQQPAAAPAGPGAPNIIRIPILISAILNSLLALSWIPFCITIILTVPLAVLAVFEILLFINLGKPDYATRKPRIKLIAILEMCAVLLGSVGALVCGIIVMVNLDKAIPDGPAAEA